MRTVVMVLGLYCWSLAAEPAMEQAAKLREVDAIAGRSYLAIQAAVPELARFGVKVNDYRIVVLEKGPSIVVLFEDPEKSLYQRGSTERMLGVEVELSRDGLRVISSRGSK